MRRWWIWLLGSLSGLIILAVAVGLFISGSLYLEGYANFLAMPHAAIKAQLGLEGINLDYVKPVARRYNVILKGGTPVERSTR